MGNEMGNRNVTGLQASEQDGNEATIDTNRSSNSSFVSNDLDGLKGVTGYLTDGSQTTESHDTKKLTNNESVDPLVVSNRCVDSDEHDIEKLGTDEYSLKSSIESNVEKNIDSSYDESNEKDDHLIQKQISEIKEDDSNYEATKATNESREPMVVSNDADALKGSTHNFPYGSQASQGDGTEKLAGTPSSETLAMPNETDNQIQTVSSREYEDLQEKQACTDQINSLENDTALNQNETLAEREEEDVRTACIQQANKKHDKLEDEKIEHIDEETSPKLSTEEETSPKLSTEIRDFLVEESGSCVESAAVEGIDRQEEQASAGLVEFVFAPTQCEDDGSSESITNAYLDAIASEIEKLVLELDPHESNDASKFETDGSEKSSDYSKEESEEKLKVDDLVSFKNIKVDDFAIGSENSSNSSKVALEEELKLDDLMMSSFDIQIRPMNLNEKVNENRENGRQEANEASINDPMGSEQSSDYSEVALQQAGMVMNSFDIQFKSIDLCEKEKEVHEEDGGLEDVIFELVIHTDKSEEVESAPEEEKDTNKDEEKIENSVAMDELFEFSSCFSGHDVVASEETVMETKDIDAEEIVIVSKVSNTEMNLSADNVSNEHVSEEIEKKTEDSNASECTAEERSEEPLQEFEQKCTSVESETLENKEELFSIEVSEGLDALMEKQNLTAENMTELQNAISPSELESSEKLTTKLNTEKLEEKTGDTAFESVKCLIYSLDSCDAEANECSPSIILAQIPQLTEASDADENIREYHISSNQEDITKISSESERSPLLNQRKPGESAVELDSEKLAAPLQDLVKKEVCSAESAEKNEEMWQSPTQKSTVTVTHSKGREKQKPRSFLFSNCMCCTTAIN